MLSGTEGPFIIPSASWQQPDAPLVISAREVPPLTVALSEPAFVDAKAVTLNSHFCAVVLFFILSLFSSLLVRGANFRVPFSAMGFLRSFPVHSLRKIVAS